MRRAPNRPVCACFAPSCCTIVVQEHDLLTTPAECNAKQTLSSHCTLQSSHPALHTSHLHLTFHTSSHIISSELFSPHHLSSVHLISSLLICQLSSTYLFSFHRSTALLQSMSSVALSHRSFDTQQAFTQRSFLIHNDSRNCSSSRRHPQQNMI